MDEYVCLTVAGRPGEDEAAFKTRLAAFWTHVLRTHPAEYERVYAEATRFARAAGRVTRQYLVGVEVVGTLTAELATAGVGFDPVDEDDLYSKYEATSPDWYQLDH